MTLASHLDNASAARVSTLIWGSPGVGKSAAIRHWAASQPSLLDDHRQPPGTRGLRWTAGRLA